MASSKVRSLAGAAELDSIAFYEFIIFDNAF